MPPGQKMKKTYMSNRLARSLAMIFVFGNASFCLLATQQTPAILVEKNVAATMRDGVRLYADVYRPVTADSVPIVLVRTPYSKDLDAEYIQFAYLAAQNGYAAIVRDVRGCFSSEGVFAPYLQELNDGYDSVEWAAALPYSNGKVGMQGFSYRGAVQWQGAGMNPPHLGGLFPPCTFPHG